MGCRFIFPESDFDLSNLIGSLSVPTSTLIGSATESSSNKFSIAVTRFLMPTVAIIKTLQSSGKPGFEGRKSSVISTFFFLCPPKFSFGI